MTKGVQDGLVGRTASPIRSQTVLDEVQETGGETTLQESSNSQPVVSDRIRQLTLQQGGDGRRSTSWETIHEGVD